MLGHVKNKSALGRLLVDWCRREEHQLPKTVFELKRELKKWKIEAKIRDSIPDDRHVNIVQTVLNEWVVPLPPNGHIEEILREIRSTGHYPVELLPSYFTAYPRNGQVYGEEFYYARLTDFTVTQGG